MQNRIGVCCAAFWLLIAGCTTQVGAGTPEDAGLVADRGVSDAGRSDGGRDGGSDLGVGNDGGLSEDAEPSDTGVDSGVTPDAAPDTGVPDDTGAPEDTGTPEDTGEPEDTGAPEDTGELDTGVPADTGADEDTGVTADTGADEDTGVTVDLGVDAGPGARSALDFPSNNGTGQPASGDATMFYFPDPQNDGLPIWGPNGEGVTYVWEYYPRQQTGYYTTFFWSNNGGFLWDSGGPNTYYGAHPYPSTSSNQGTAHNWEISIGGGDVIATRSGAPHLVIKDRWYRQALRVIREADGTKRLIYYLDLPSTADADVIEVLEGVNYGETLPPAPALVFGNAPWRLSFQDERLSGYLRGIKIFNIALSEADTLAESAADTLVTAQGQARIWYGKINPTPADLSCDFGTGRTPLWADNGRPGLYVE